MRVTVLVLAALALLAGPARADDAAVDAAKLYDFKVEATPSVQKGAKGSVQVKIQPKPGAEIHKEAPIKLALKAPGNVTLSKEKLGRAELKMSGNDATFDVPFDAAAPGKAKVEADLSFYICTEKLCVRQQRTASADVDVK